MVIGGHNGPNDLSNVEIIDLHSYETVCQPVQNFPIKIRGISGGLIEKKTPIVCGGLSPYSNKCYMYIKPNWIPFAAMTVQRYHFGILPITDFAGKKALLFATGSANELYSEIYDGTVWSVANITNIPFTTYISCVMYANDTTIMISGGSQNQKYNGEMVFFMSLVTNVWIQGPSFINGRFGHSCGLINKDFNTNQKSIIVVGGLNGDLYTPISSVEILDDGAKSWRSGR